MTIQRIRYTSKSVASAAGKTPETGRRAVLTPCPVSTKATQMSSFRWSFSGLMLFEQCGFKYAAQYLKHRVEAELSVGLPPRTFHPAATRGTELHAAIDKHLTEGAPLPNELKYWAPAFHEIKSYHIKSEHRIAVRKDWTVCGWTDPDVWCRAILDLLAQKPQNLMAVYDWKTGKQYDEHYDQKEHYALMTIAEHPALSMVRAVHVYLDYPNTQPTVREYTPIDLVARRIIWTERANKLEAATNDPDLLRAFPMQPNKFCKWCDLRRSAGGPCKFA